MWANCYYSEDGTRRILSIEGQSCIFQDKKLAEKCEREQLVPELKGVLKSNRATVEASRTAEQIHRTLHIREISFIKFKDGK